MLIGKFHQDGNAISNHFLLRVSGLYLLRVSGFYLAIRAEGPVDKSISSAHRHC